MEGATTVTRCTLQRERHRGLLLRKPMALTLRSLAAFGMKGLTIFPYIDSCPSNTPMPVPAMFSVQKWHSPLYGLLASSTKNSEFWSSITQLPQTSFTQDGHCWAGSKALRAKSTVLGSLGSPPPHLLLCWLGPLSCPCGHHSLGFLLSLGAHNGDLWSHCKLAWTTGCKVRWSHPTPV